MNNTPLRKTTSDVSISVDHIEQFAHGWILDCEYRQLSQRTIEFRRGFAKNYLWWLRHYEYSYCGKMELRAFLRYVATGHNEPGGRWGNPLCNRPLRPRTIKDYYTSLHTFFSWIESEGYIEQNPMDEVKPPIYRPDQIQPFNEEQIKNLLSAAKHSNNPLRNVSIILFLLDTGVRNSELCALHMNEVDMVNKKAIVLGKGNKHRAVYFGRETSRMLWKYIRSRNTKPSDPLFVSERGGQLTRSGLQQLIERLGRVAKIEAVRCSPHTFRHTCAVWFLRNGGQVFALREMLGHTDLGMTNRYVAIAQADVQNQHRRFSPVERLNYNRS